MSFSFILPPQDWQPQDAEQYNQEHLMDTFVATSLCDCTATNAVLTCTLQYAAIARQNGAVQQSEAGLSTVAGSLQSTVTETAILVTSAPAFSSSPYLGGRARSAVLSR